MDNWVDFFFAFVKGPGWFPGTERLGDITFVPEVFELNGIESLPQALIF